MIRLLLSKDEFEYDIQGLVKSFYPGEATVTNQECDAGLTLEVQYNPEKIVVSLWTAEENGENASKDPAVLTKELTEVDYANRQETKNRLKRLIYRMLQAAAGKELPWGTLTGIRPTKLPMGMLEQGLKEEQILEQLKENYYVSDRKAELSLAIAEKEYSLLKRLDYKNGYSLYVGIPFCPSTCLYCSFPSYPIASYRKKVDAYLDALTEELRYLSEEFKNKNLQTIYIGGGTPTTLEPEQLARLITTIRTLFDCSRVSEFTIEAGRPDSITEEKLRVIRENGISRISINPQTMQDKTLKLIGRHHTVEDIKEKFLLARKLGFDNINMDIIVGLPGETRENVEDTLRQIAALGPDSLTVHSLAIKRAARLNIMRDIYKDYHFENSDEIMDMVAEYAEKMGLSPYYLYRQKNMAGNQENVGYAKPEKECLYNVLIMEEKQTIAAAGAGSSTKYVYDNGTKIERAENVKNVDQYIERVKEMIYRKKCLFWKSMTEQETMMYKLISHGATVSNLAVAVSRELGMEEDFIYNIAVAGLFHDIGKGQMRSVMQGERTVSGLNIEKTRRLREHAAYGYQILKERGYSDFIAEAVLYHHENWDGTGYPQNLKGEEIPIAARILRVCDVFAALSSERWYRKAYTPDEAMRLMIEESGYYDMKVFLALQRVYLHYDWNQLKVTTDDILCFRTPEEEQAIT